MKRVLVVHADLESTGGGQAATLWALKALTEEFETTLLSYREPDVDRLNSIYGCALQSDRLRIVRMPAWLEWGFRLPRFRGNLLRAALLGRYARRLHAQAPYDALLSMDDEVDLGGEKALAYIHFPWAYVQPDENALTWRHRIPLVSPLYPRFAKWIEQESPARLRRQSLLANSEFVAARVFKVHGVRPQVVFPPAPGGFLDTPWSDRRLAAVAIGRLSPEKRWHEAVEAADRVRALGRPLALTLIGAPGPKAYGRLLDGLARTRPWFRVLRGIPRHELVREVSQHRYGIHPMQGEHFGIAVAELLRAGCLPFVHNSGGPREIVGGMAELMFDTPDEAARRIVAMMDASERELTLRQAMRERAQLFTETRFMAEIRRLVRNVIET